MRLSQEVLLLFLDRSVTARSYLLYVDFLFATWVFASWVPSWKKERKAILSSPYLGHTSDRTNGKTVSRRHWVRDPWELPGLLFPNSYCPSSSTLSWDCVAIDWPHLHCFLTDEANRTSLLCGPGLHYLINSKNLNRPLTLPESPQSPGTFEWCL